MVRTVQVCGREVDKYGRWLGHDWSFHMEASNWDRRCR